MVMERGKSEEGRGRETKGDGMGYSEGRGGLMVSED